MVVAQVVGSGYFDLSPVHQSLVLGGRQGEVVPMETRRVATWKINELHTRSYRSEQFYKLKKKSILKLRKYFEVNSFFSFI